MKESIFVHALKPSLNRDGGRFNLFPIWHNSSRWEDWKRGAYQGSQVLVASPQHQSEAAIGVNKAGVPAESFWAKRVSLFNSLNMYIWL